MKLCRPCAEELKRSGQKLAGKSLGANVKITCERCKRRRYGQEYVKKQI